MRVNRSITYKHYSSVLSRGRTFQQKPFFKEECKHLTLISIGEKLELTLKSVVREREYYKRRIKGVCIWNQWSKVSDKCQEQGKKQEGVRCRKALPSNQRWCCLLILPKFPSLEDHINRGENEAFWSLWAKPVKDILASLAGTASMVDTPYILLHFRTQQHDASGTEGQVDENKFKELFITVIDRPILKLHLPLTYTHWGSLKVTYTLVQIHFVWLSTCVRHIILLFWQTLCIGYTRTIAHFYETATT